MTNEQEQPPALTHEQMIDRLRAPAEALEYLRALCRCVQCNGAQHELNQQALATLAGVCERPLCGPVAGRLHKTKKKKC